VVQPVRTTVSAVVTSISPPRAITLMNHGLGVTAEQNVSFRPDLKGGTRVCITMDLVGKSSELSEKALREAIAFVIKDALDTMESGTPHLLPATDPTGASSMTFGEIAVH
jgi:hypothetical protein